ncbi:MAG: PadR family transcriptional regulator [Thermoplasmata archaeon]
MEDYVNRVLLLLRFSEMSSYSISKNLNYYSDVSHGAVVPVLKRLTESGMISFRQEGRKKLYSLTEKGKKYIESLETIQDSIKEKIFVESFHKSMMFLDLLSNENDAELIREVLEDVSIDIIRIITKAFKYRQAGNEAQYKDLRKKIAEIAREVYEAN